jgi:hypothetical protein
LKAARAALLPQIPAAFPKEWQPAPKALVAAKSIPGIQQGTPARIEINRSSDFARGRTAVLPTFHHDRRDVIATATIRLTR